MRRLCSFPTLNLPREKEFELPTYQLQHRSFVSIIVIDIHSSIAAGRERSVKKSYKKTLRHVKINRKIGTSKNRHIRKIGTSKKTARQKNRHIKKSARQKISTSKKSARQKIAMKELQDTRIGFRQVSTYRPSHPVPKQSCLDQSGEMKADGRYYTPVGRLCTLCMCDNGRPDACITLRCRTPECDDYEQVSGTCCRYRCPGELQGIPDTTTLAVIISLVVVLLLTLAAIVFVVRKLKRGSTRGGYAAPISRPPAGHVTNSSCPSLQLNTLPNNLRPPVQTSTPIPPSLNNTMVKKKTNSNKNNNNNNNNRYISLFPVI